MTTAYIDEQFTASQLTLSRASDFIRLGVRCLGDFSNGGGDGTRRLSSDVDRIHAAELHAALYPRSVNADIVRKMMVWTKAGVDAGTSVDTAWAAPLAPYRALAQGFVDLSRPASLVGKLLAAGARQVPFQSQVTAVSGSGTYQWAGQGAPKVVGNLQLSSVLVPPAKASGILLLSAELAKLSTPSAETLVRNDMIRGISKYLDAQLTDPAVAAVTNVSPASLTNNAPSIGSSGSSAANAATDVKALVAAFINMNPDADGFVLMMSPTVAVALAIATGSQTLTARGGSLFGVPVLTGTTGNRVIAVDPSAVLIADDSDADITVSRNATLQLDTAPTSPPTASTVYLSAWQHNLLAVKIDRFVNWKLARPSAILYTTVSYI